MASKNLPFEFIYKWFDQFTASGQAMSPDSIRNMQKNDQDLENYLATVRGIPAGGSTGEVLTKVSGDNYDVDWETGGGGGGGSQVVSVVFNQSGGTGAGGGSWTDVGSGDGVAPPGFSIHTTAAGVGGTGATNGGVVVTVPITFVGGTPPSTGYVSLELSSAQHHLLTVFQSLAWDNLIGLESLTVSSAVDPARFTGGAQTVVLTIDNETDVDIQVGTFGSNGGNILGTWA